MANTTSGVFGFRFPNQHYTAVIKLSNYISFLSTVNLLYLL